MGPGRGEIPCAPEVLWSQRVSVIPGILWVREIPGWLGPPTGPIFSTMPINYATS